MCDVCEGRSEEMYNPDCDDCAGCALQDWITHMEAFKRADFPKSYECDKDGVSWFDLMHFESTYPALDSWDNVNGRWHGAMCSFIYRAESGLRAGVAITRELFCEYLDELKTN